MSNYLIELGIIHTLLILGYWLFLRNEQQYAKMRLYLIGATGISLIIPSLSIPLLFGNDVEPIAIVTPLQALSIKTIPITPNETSLWNVEMIKWAYLAISGFFLIKILSSLRYLSILDKKSRYEKFQQLYIRRVSGIKGSFSFLNRIFLSESVEKNQKEYDTILEHEKAHIDLGHSYDILFFEVFRMLFWWLPGSWYIRKEIKKIHEYQADKYALKTSNPEEYATILISSTLKLNGLALASSFHDGLITQRLKAMKATVKTLRPWKIITLGSLATLLLIVFSCNEELDNEIKKMGSQSNAITFDQLPAEMQSKFRDDRDALSFIKINIEKGQKVSDVYDLLNVDREMVGSVYYGHNEVYAVLKKGAKQFDYVSEKSKIESEDGEIFTIVEEQPEYPGGIDAFHRYISNNMVYPSSARKNGIKGRVYVQFTVDKDGSISDVESVKGIGAGCDEEAVRVVQNAGKFNPGRQRGKPVRVRMVLPIKFDFDEKPNPARISVGEVKSTGGKLKVDALYDNGQWTGQVSSPEGDPLPGANIVIAGGSLGTHSDINGDFQLKTDQDKDLIVSFVGYKTVQIEVQPKN